MFINIDNAKQAGLDIRMTEDSDGNECLTILPRDTGERLDLSMVYTQLKDYGLDEPVIVGMLEELEQKAHQAVIWSRLQDLDISEP